MLYYQEAEEKMLMPYFWLSYAEGAVTPLIVNNNKYLARLTLHHSCHSVTVISMCEQHTNLIPDVCIQQHLGSKIVNILQVRPRLLTQPSRGLQTERKKQGESDFDFLLTRPLSALGCLYLLQDKQMELPGEPQAKYCLGTDCFSQ